MRKDAISIDGEREKIVADADGASIDRETGVLQNLSQAGSDKADAMRSLGSADTAASAGCCSRKAAFMIRKLIAMKINFHNSEQ